MNLYVPNAQLDSPFGYGDLEWLYRQQDVDGGSLVSRLAQLAPISFTNTIDGQRRRRLFALDSWEMNNFAWTNDNPGGLAFAYNARFKPNADAGFTTLNVPASTNPNIVPPISTPALPNPTNAAPVADAVAGPARQEDQPQLPAAGLQRSQRADPPEVDQRHLPDAQGDLAAAGGRYGRGAGAAQPVRDQHHRLPRYRRHHDALAEPGRVPASWHRRRQPVPGAGDQQGGGRTSRWTSTAWSTTRSPSTR